MRIQPLCTGALAILCAGIRVTPAGAQSFREWTACAPRLDNGFVTAPRSCLTTRLETDPILSGGTRTGTSVSLLMRNLQGSAEGLALGDNATWSGFGDMVFFGPSGGIYDFTHYGILPALLGGATGTAINDRQVVTTSNQQGNFLLFVDDNTPRTTVGGCSPRPGATLNYSPALFTCAATSWVDFSYTTTAVFDATNFDGFHAQLFRTYGNSDDARQCFSMQTSWAQGFCQLEIASESSQVQPDITVTPEPGTLGLMSLALLVGIGLVRQRAGRDWPPRDTRGLDC